MDGKELEIKRKFKAGDSVVFRLGERENYTCPHCGVPFYDSELEDRLIVLSGQAFRIMGTCEELVKTGFFHCHRCRGEVWLPGSDYVLLHSHIYSNGVEASGFVVYEVELSPAPVEDESGGIIHA